MNRINFEEDEIWTDEKLENLVGEAEKKIEPEVTRETFDPKNPPKHCTYLHPPLPLDINGATSYIYGSSCADPLLEDADLYISLDSYTKVFDWEKPWHNANGRVHIRLPIQDMHVPKNDNEFISCLSYTMDKLAAGELVHVGCIAGHGRTGTFLAALTQITMGKKLDEYGVSAIDYVRDNYCGKAVESLSQILYLHTLLGVGVPQREKWLVNEFKEDFKKAIGIEFNDVVKKSGFSYVTKVIDDLEKAIYERYKPKTEPVVAPRMTRADFLGGMSKYPPVIQTKEANDNKFGLFKLK